MGYTASRCNCACIPWATCEDLIGWDCLMVSLYRNGYSTKSMMWRSRRNRWLWCRRNMNTEYGIQYEQPRIADPEKNRKFGIDCRVSTWKMVVPWCQWWREIIENRKVFETHHGGWRIHWLHGVSLQPVCERDEGVANRLGVIYIDCAYYEIIEIPWHFAKSQHFQNFDTMYRVKKKQRFPCQDLHLSLFRS